MRRETRAFSLSTEPHKKVVHTRPNSGKAYRWAAYSESHAINHEDI